MQQHHLHAVYQELKALEMKTREAAEKHNQFLRELGLLDLPVL
jgi:hypothetical protein